jgi:DNA-binding Xre family transcriptional regulator
MKGEDKVAVSYKKLWKLLIDRDLKKKDLRAATGISSASIAKLSKNENVTTDVLVRICNALECELSDIMALEQEQKKKNN